MVPCVGGLSKVFFFEKKEAKNFYPFGLGRPAISVPHRKSFLVLFFQKRTASFLLRRLPQSSASRDRAQGDAGGKKGGEEEKLGAGGEAVGGGVRGGGAEDDDWDGEREDEDGEEDAAAARAEDGGGAGGAYEGEQGGS